MIVFKRGWVGRAIGAAMAVGLMTNVSLAAMGAPEVEKVVVPSAASLVRFYPTPLASTPSGIVEDQDVWLAKVQGLMASAPSMLQQSLLMSQTKHDFAANVTLLQQLQTGSIKQSAVDLRSQAKGGGFTKSLGDPSNLVYKELEPCRIMDTRSASGASGVQGPILGGALKSIPGYISAGQNWSAYGQTGTLSDCGLTDVYGPSIYAVAIVITVLNPNFDAYLGVGDVSNLATTLSTVAVNFTHGQGISTLYVVPQNSNTIRFAMPTGLSANIIFDVVGLYHRSDATALECNDVTLSTAMTAGSYTTLTPACGTGFTRTGGGCYVDGFTTMNWLINSNVATRSDAEFFCGGTSNAANTLHADARCCRIPGR